MAEMPSRGDVWLVNLSPTRGHEQAGQRPALVVSDDLLNHGPSGLVAVLPVTTTDRGIPLHVALRAGEGGLSRPSFVLCDQVRTISRERLLRRYGAVAASSMEVVEYRLRIVLGL